MISRLYVNGCSWTAGNELEQDTEFRNYISAQSLRFEDPSDPNNWRLLNDRNEVFSNAGRYFDIFNWAGRLKNNLGVTELVNHAEGGASNRRILRTTCDYLLSTTPDERDQLLVVIGWTVSERSEIYIERNGKGNWQRFNPTQKFSSTYDHMHNIEGVELNVIDELQEKHTAYIHSDYAGIFDYFQSSYLLANLLENLNVRYLFFNALPPWWIGGHLKTTCDVESQFATYLNWHEQHKHSLHYTDTMYGFVHNNNFPVGQYLHPLVQGHRAWADYLTEIIENKSTL